MARIVRMTLDGALTVCKALRPGIAICWEYAKVEIVPPMTRAFFQGPGGRALEASCRNFSGAIMGAMENTIRGIDNAAAQKIAQKAAAEKAKLDKIKAQEDAKKKLAEEAAKKTAAAQAQKAEAKKKEEAKKAEAKKAEPKKAEAKTPAPKKK